MQILGPPHKSCSSGPGSATATAGSGEVVAIDAGVITRVGDSRYGGWYEVECGLSVEYRRRGVLRLITDPAACEALDRKIEEYNKQENVKSQKARQRERERERERLRAANKKDTAEKAALKAKTTSHSTAATATKHKKTTSAAPVSKEVLRASSKQSPSAISRPLKTLSIAVSTDEDTEDDEIASHDGEGDESVADDRQNDDDAASEEEDEPEPVVDARSSKQRRVHSSSGSSLSSLVGMKRKSTDASSSLVEASSPKKQAFDAEHAEAAILALCAIAEQPTRRSPVHTARPMPTIAPVATSPAPAPVAERKLPPIAPVAPSAAAATPVAAAAHATPAPTVIAAPVAVAVRDMPLLSRVSSISDSLGESPTNSPASSCATLVLGTIRTPPGDFRTLDTSRASGTSTPINAATAAAINSVECAAIASPAEHRHSPLRLPQQLIPQPLTPSQSVSYDLLRSTQQQQQLQHQMQQQFLLNLQLQQQQHLQLQHQQHQLQQQQAALGQTHPSYSYQPNPNVNVHPHPHSPSHQHPYAQLHQTQPKPQQMGGIYGYSAAAPQASAPRDLDYASVQFAPSPMMLQHQVAQPLMPPPTTQMHAHAGPYHVMEHDAYGAQAQAHHIEYVHMHAPPPPHPAHLYTQQQHHHHPTHPHSMQIMQC